MGKRERYILLFVLTRTTLYTILNGPDSISEPTGDVFSKEYSNDGTNEPQK